MHQPDKAFSLICCLLVSLLRWHSRFLYLYKQSLLNMHIFLSQLLSDQYMSVFSGIPTEQKASKKWAELSQNPTTLSLGQLGAVASYLAVPTIPAFGVSLEFNGCQSQNDTVQQNENRKAILTKPETCLCWKNRKKAQGG